MLGAFSLTPYKERERKRRIKEEQQRQEKMETQSNSSAVSDDTCCTCRKPYEGNEKIAKCSGKILRHWLSINSWTPFFVFIKISILVCMRSSHIECLQISDDQHAVIQTYNWACIECKTCTICAQAKNEDQILFCDRCDRGYHTFCVALRWDLQYLNDDGAVGYKCP